MKLITSQVIIIPIVLLLMLSPIYSSAQYTYTLIDNAGNSQVLTDNSVTNICSGLEYTLSVTIGSSTSDKSLVVENPSTDIVINNQAAGTDYCSNPGTATHIIPFTILLPAATTTAVRYTLETARHSGSCARGAAKRTFNFDVFPAALLELDPTYEACSNSSFILHEEGGGPNDRCRTCVTGTFTRTFEWTRVDTLNFAGTSQVTNATGFTTPITSTNLDHTIALNDLAAVNAATSQNGGRIRMMGVATTSHTNGLTCRDTQFTDIIIFPAPVLSAITTVSTPSGANSSAADELCIDGTRNYQVNCTGGGCPTGNSDYSWNLYTDPIGGFLYWEADVTNFTSNASSSSATYSPATLTYDTTQPRQGVFNGPVLPGAYTALVVAQNPNTSVLCEDYRYVDLILNPKPGVEIFHNAGTGNYGAGDFTVGANGTVICNGVDVGLSLRDCNNAAYSSNATPNNDADPNNNTIGSVPCTGSGLEYFQSVTWTASTIVSGSPVALNVTDPSGPTTSSSVTINPTSAATNYVTSTAGFGGGTSGNTITYTASVIGANGCTNEDNIEIVVQDPTLTFAVDNVTVTGQPHEVCQNTSPSLSVTCDLCIPQGTFSSGGSISWTDPGSLLSSTNTNPVSYNSAITAAGGTTQNFTVNLTGDNGCIAPATTLDLLVEERPNIAPTLVNSMPMCSADDLLINVTTGYNANYRYGVYTTDPTVGSPTDYLNCANNCGTTLTIPSASVANGVNYYVRAVSTGGCEDVEQVGVTTSINQTPTISLQSYPSSICNNRYTTFRIDGDFDYNYTWYLDTSTITGTSSYSPGAPGYDGKSNGFGWSSDYAYYTLRPGMGANPTLRISVDASFNGCTSSLLNLPDITVQECNTPVISKFLNNGPNSSTREYKYICVGDDLGIRVTLPNSSGTVTYAWSTGETTNTINYVATTSSPDSIVHTVTVTDNNGTQVTSTVTYISQGGVNLIPSTDTTICANGQINALANCPGCFSEVNYLWYNDGTITPFESDVATDGNIYHSAVVLPPSPIVTSFPMSLVVTHGETCRDTIERLITVDGLPEPVITEVSTGDTIRTVQYLCTGETLQLEVGCATCNTYVWNTTATTPVINVNSPGVYFARALNANLCSEISQTVVVLGAPDGYNSPVTVNPSEICAGQPSTLEIAPCIGCSYEWFNTNNTTTPVVSNRVHSTALAGNYYGEVTNSNNCTYPTSIVSLSNTAVTIPTISSTTDSICTGRTSRLSTASLPGASYQWYRDTFPISGAIDSVYVTSVAGFYNVLVTYANGCEEFSPSVELVDISFNPIITSADTVVCFGLTEEIVAPIVPGWQYQWYSAPNNILVNGNGSSYFADSSGSYYVQITDNNLCVEESNVIYMTISNIPASNASTSTPAVCPGDEGVLSVSLCSGCEYEWFSINTASSISQGKDLTYYRYNITPTATGSYYAVVSKDGCEVISDTISVVLNTAPIPPINFLSRVVCDGRDAVLNTQSCPGCSYTWLKDGVEAIGALNDTFHIVNRVADVGDYSVIVNYPNSCSDTSTTITVSDGTYSVNIASLQQAGTAPNTVICNGSGIQVRANNIYPGVAPVGTYTYTLFIDNNPVTGSSNIASNSVVHSFYNNVTEGVYTIEVVDPQGCKQKSGFISLDTVNIIPVLEARATSNPNSVPASAICANDGTVFMEVTVSNCPTCTYNYQWVEGGINLVGTNTNTYLTPQGPAGAGIYTVDVTRRGCTATSNTASIINATAGFNNSITPDTASICNGQSTTLRYNGATCNGCSYRWLRTGNPIGGANNQQYVATTQGDYSLEVTTPLGCVDTSATSAVLSIARPDSFRLQLDTVVAILGTANSGTATPIAASATGINLNSWVFPDSVRNGSLSAASGNSSYFTSDPFNAALNCGGALICNPGLSGADSSLFTPADSLVGNHLITYHYIESGCEFIAQDVLKVVPAATISITNNNPASVPYEACIGDNLNIRAENMKFRIEEVYVFDANGDYQLASIPAINFSYDTTTYGSDTFYTSTIVWTVPGDAYASYLNLKAAPPAGQDTILTPFLLIHNTDLSFAGLPSSGELCSNGARLTLFGNPQGGSFSVRDMAGNNMPGTIVGDSLYPTAINPLLYNDTSQLVDVVYNYRETYTNGNNCPNLDFVTQRIKAIDVQLTNVDWNTISVSQDQELLTNLVYRVQPYNARANKQDFYTSSFSGSFTSPAGAPVYFLPTNAGVGRHALTYTITHGTCSNSVEDSIQVVPAPTNIAIPDTICRDFAPVNFRRDIAFPYIPPAPFSQNLVVDYTDSVYVLRVRGEGVVVTNPNLGSERYTYVPTNVAGNHDTLVVEYVFYRDEDTSTVDFDTLEYVVASIIKPIYIEDLLTVDINDTVVQSFYCQDSTLSILTASPPDSFGRGLFMLYGGTGQYQFGDTLFNNVINPYQVNNSENATTTYDLVYILNGAACQNADTMPITISKGLNPAFATVNGLDEFCETDPAVAITHNVLPPDTAIWKIGGIPQPSYSFNPTPLNPGIHVVDLQQIYTYVQGIDTFVCSAIATDTFTIHALPNISVTPSLDKQYCANDPIVDFVVSPSPDCPNFGAAGHYLLDENFNSGVPASWVVNTIAGKPWAPDALYPQGGTGLATFVDTSSVVDNSWLISPSMNLIAGHTYRLSYMVLAGPANANCGGGCVASLYVGLGNSTATTSITTQLDYQPQINNDLAYQRHTVDYYHNPAAGATTGTFHLGFRNFSPAYGRSLRLDNVEMRDLTVDSCRQAGIGYLEGPGAYKVRDSLYQFDPLSAPIGNITVKYVYTNTMGCQDSMVFPIQVDTAPVVSFTNLDSSYCENEPTVMLTGSPLGGTFTSTRGTNLYDDTTFATLSPAFYPVSFQTNTPGLDIVSYTFTDNNNCSATAVDSVYIVRLLDKNVITGLNTRGYGYCIIDSANVITVTNQQPLGSGSLITNGTFYGPGVRNGAAGAGVATFHSDSAVIDMGHTGDVTVSYVYTTTTQCQDTSFKTFRVHASPDLSFVNLPDSLCLNADSFRVVVKNRVVTGPTGQTVYIDTIGRQVGQFTETDIYGNPVDDFIQLFDTLYPYEANGYSQINVSYYYITDTALGACEATLEDSVRIDSVPIVYFQGLRDHYCENDPISIFLAFPSFNIGSGYLLIDSNQIDSSFYWIDPAVMVGPGQTTAVYPTYYTFTDSRGCQGEVFDTFEVRPYPRITFSPTAQDTFCRQVGQRYDLRQLITAPIGGFFTDNLALTSIRDSFYLDLGSQPGPRLVTYNYLDPTTLCQNSDSITIYLFSAPELDFAVYGGCSQMDITFSGSANNLIAGIDSITSIWWDFEGNGVLTYTQLDTTPITIPDTTYQYNSPGTYNVTLYVQNQGACVQSVTKPLIISPYHNLTNNDYFEDFNTGAGDWYNDQPINVSPGTDIWTYEPSLNGAQISSPDGAWVTRADSLYHPGESAWVYSPCFDFSNSIRPMIAFDLWRDMFKNIDGAIMEYYDNTTNTWERLGDVGEGISWYQSNILLARPGNQQGVSLPRGWTGRSGGFESARLRLDQFKGQRDIRFRIAFATSPQTVIDSLSGAGFEGAAFDNVWVGERTRNVLVEHFSNQNYVTVGGLTSDNIDRVVYNKIFNSDYGNDVVLLQYQVDDNSIATPDPIYQSNSADLGGRSFDYSTAPGEILIDGRLIGTGRSENLDEWEMDHDMLQFPSFEVRIGQPITIVNNTLSSNATVEALEDMPYDDYIIHMAIMQDSFTYNSRNFNMLNIVRKMEPNNTGVPESHDWVTGQTATIAHSWDYTNQLNVASFNPDQLEVVVFIQNDNTDEVYQVATTQDMNRYNGTQTIPTDPRTEIFDLTVYPNPSSNWFNVSFDKALQQAYNWRLVDVTGRTLQMGTAEAGTEKFTIDANQLTDGAYFFVINSEDNEVYAQRKLIVIKH